MHRLELTAAIDRIHKELGNHGSLWEIEADMDFLLGRRTETWEATLFSNNSFCLVIRSKHKSHFSPKTLRENVLKQNCRSERIGVPHKGQLGVFFDLPLKSFVETANHRCGYNLEGNEPVVDGASTTDT